MKKLLFYCVMLLGTGAVILGGIELVLPRFARTVHVTHHRWGNRPYTLLPNAVHRASTSYFDNTLRANSLGFNDVEHALARPPGTLRVLLLGDSFVEGLQVPPEKNMARLLEQRAAREGRALEVISMGISGYGQSHELATYESVGAPFHADVVIAFFCPNDLWNNLVGIEGESGPPFFTLDAGGNLVATLAGRPETPPTPHEIRKHERVPRFPGLRVAKKMTKAALRLLDPDVRGAARAALSELPDAGTSGAGAGEGNAGADVAAGGARAADRDADAADGARADAGPTPAPRWVRPEQEAMFEKLIARMKSEVVDRDGSRMLAVIVSGNVRQPAPRRYLRMKRWVAGTFASQGVETLDFDAVFRERSARELRFPSWEKDLHWNETGHAWAADALYAALEPLLAAPRAAAAPQRGLR